MPDGAQNVAHAPALVLLWWQSGGAGGDFALMLFQTFIALGLVCGLALIIFRWVLPRLNVARAAGGMVRVVERVPLDARKTLFVVEAAGRWLLVAASEAGVQVLTELEAETAEEAEREAARLRPQFGAQAAAMRGAFAERFAQMLNNRKGGRGR